MKRINRKIPGTVIKMGFLSSGLTSGKGGRGEEER